jgi:hypothetical protein
MRTSRIRFTLTLIPALLTTAYVSGASAFKLETHEAVNIRAAAISILDTYLREELALTAGLGESFTRQSGDSWRAIDWIRLGGRVEDLYNESQWFGAAYRSKNHFHNPIVPAWADSGLRTLSICPPFAISGESSPRWAQDPDQGQSGQASWADARRFYLGALTRSAGADREDAWSRTFEILGQQMHLIADLAVPAHTRNDIHCPVSDRFELWARKNSPKVDAILNMSFQSVDPGIFSINVPVDDQMAKVPIARLMDTDQYDGTNPTDTVRFAVGLAEYTNANFFSDHTVFDDHRLGDPSFRYPSSASVVLGAEEDAHANVRRRYFLKTQDGDTGYRLAVPSALYESLPDALRDQEKALDDKVLEDYATRLLPRAVTYSAALLDYFFRGKLEARIGPDPQAPQTLLFAGKNASNEALSDGTLKVYGDYASEGRTELGSWTISGPIAPGVDLLPGQPVSLSPLADRPVPERYMVVYQGSLGEEKKDSPPGFGGAVIGKAAKYLGVIEQLFVNQVDGEVYFRNGTLVTKLEVRSQMRPGSQISLRSWGSRNDTFLVEGAVRGEDVSHFYVFTLSRPQADRVFRDPPRATLIRGPELFDVQWMRGLPLGFGGVNPLNYLAALDDNLDVILPGYYVVYSPDPYSPDLTDLHGVVVNNTARTVLFDLRAAALGAPTPGPSAQSEAVPQMILRLDAIRRDRSRIVVSGSQFDRTGQGWGYLGVVDGNGTEVARFVDWEPFRSAYLLGRLARGGKHILWAKFDDNDRDGTNTAVYASYVDGGASRQIGTGDADWELVARASLVPVASDFLLRVAAPVFFVKGWTPDGTVVLAQAETPGFPPEDANLSPLKRLADPPSGVSVPTDTFCGFGYCSVWQVIEDPELLE